MCVCAERSNLMIVDLDNFHIIKEIQGISQDMQSAVTNHGWEIPLWGV